ncbi:N,N-dimethylformamidase beta subunit family domain-containing protein [Amycolatopsis magusensis]|uniref:N,N-dimethylformamidase beta subunit family domain-containing protein n=1 Tax=Amycolatopsis magusensis TaxID=882444 RepID=UPI0024A7E00C|nr:N,N-dimethylformamidase beta subunit family domain-containing protein [Amycolatopsis magusensis]MDI5975709.1 tachylectin-related carbohydrate-binding protein [Amycolatopsis magusensis]
MGMLSGREPLPIIEAEPPARPAGALAAAGTFDPRQRWSRLVGGGDGIIYAVQADGLLYWYRHRGWATASSDWANEGIGVHIGSGWQDFVTVLGDVDGVLYGVRGDGDVLAYQRVVTDMDTGAGYWTGNGTGVVVGTGFAAFPRIFGGPGGVIWCVDADGVLYRSRRPSGGHFATPVPLADGFNVPRYLFSDVGNVIYTVSGTGGLTWFRYRDGVGWANGGQPFQIGDNDWFELFRRDLFAGCGNGGLYFVRIDLATVPGDDETLVELRLTNHQSVDTDGGPQWINNATGVIVGHGFTVERSVGLQGYPRRQSVPTGGRASFALSTAFSSVSAEIVRVTPGGDTPEPVTARTTVTGGLQMLAADYRSAGCGWDERYGAEIPADWPSGVYAARFTGDFGRVQHVPFVVRPAAPEQKIAVVLPSNTYHAYNGWGGHDQYSVGQDGVRRVFTFLRPSYNWLIASKGQYDVDLFSDLELLRWLSTEEIGVDCYTDHDLHTGGWLSAYNAIVLGGHPEYWSMTMRAHLAGYLAAGGSVIGTGGNQLYERAEFDADGTTLTFRAANGSRDLLLNNYDLPASQLLGVNYEHQGWMTFAPYRVLREHPFLAGTGLGVGETFGASGRNGAASAWEFDTLQGFDGEASPEEVFAQGTNPTDSGGAAMVCKELPGGGFVFSASSLTFNGAIRVDAVIQRLLRNVFDRALERSTPPRKKLP